jgi:transposase
VLRVNLRRAQMTRPGNRLATEWLLKLLQHKPRKLVAVALANKMARIAWAMMTSGETYRHQPPMRSPPNRRFVT